MRHREVKQADLDRAKAAVAAWREQNPQGSYGEMEADLSGQFRDGYGVILRGILFAVDSHNARIAKGIVISAGVRR
jgi:hypothetical protein